MDASGRCQAEPQYNGVHKKARGSGLYGGRGVRRDVLSGLDVRFRPTTAFRVNTRAMADRNQGAGIRAVS